MAYRTHNFSLRLTTHEITAYERLASESGVSVSEWARNVLNKEVKQKQAAELLAEYFNLSSTKERE